MKNLSLMFGVALMSSTMMAQNVYVHTNDGSAYEYEVQDVDSIDFKLGASKLAAPSTDSECEKRLNDPEFLLGGIAKLLQDKDDENSALKDSLKKLDSEIAALRKELNECKNGSTDEPIVCIPDTYAVDLGLSVRWAGMNLGASDELEFGKHYSWGETTPVDGTYDYDGWTKEDLINKGIITADGTLTPEHDAATVNWGECWRMPTAKEAQELIDKCKWERITLFGVDGYRVEGPTRNSIFLPSVGIKKDETSSPSTTTGYYWTSTLSTVSDEYGESYVQFSDGTLTLHWKHTRYDGVVIRPVWNGK